MRPSTLIKDLVRMPIGTYMIYEIPNDVESGQKVASSLQSYATRAGATITQETLYGVNKDGQYIRRLIMVVVTQQGRARSFDKGKV